MESNSIPARDPVTAEIHFAPICSVCGTALGVIQDISYTVQGSVINPCQCPNCRRPFMSIVIPNIAKEICKEESL